MARFSLFGGTDPAEVSASNDSVAVLGLGRFGSSLALELMENGAQVLAVDSNADLVQRHNTKVTHVVRADTTDEDVLRELGIADFDRVVVAIGSEMEASILTASLVLGMGVRHVWAKAVSDAHARILRQLGVEHVVQPEKDTGRRVAHLVRGQLQDYVEIGTNFALVRAQPPRSLQGRTLAEVDTLATHGVKIIAVKKPGGGWVPTETDTVLESGDTVQVIGPVKRVEAFADAR